MAAILELIFHSFWTFVGSMILLVMLCWLLRAGGAAIAAVLRAWRH